MEKKKKIKVICNSSPIIGLAKLERLDILGKLYQEIFIPEAVFDELISKGRDKGKTAEINDLIEKKILSVQKVHNRELIRALRKDLDYGEAEVIALALELQADLVILDEKDARDMAEFHNLKKIGLLGILIRAKERGLISSIKEYMDRLINVGFRIDENLYDLIVSSLEELIIMWTGPYSWPEFEKESNLPPIPRQPGVYLQTVEYQNGYLIYAAGISRRPISTRFREHTYKYNSGDYNVLDLAAMQNGLRREIWHGWGWSPEKRVEFEKRKSTILKAVHSQLAGFRIFVANIGTKSRILERIEAAIMNNLYREPSPLCDIPDSGMMLAPRRNSENPITVINKCAAVLYGLPPSLEI